MSNWAERGGQERRKREEEAARIRRMRDTAVERFSFDTREIYDLVPRIMGEIRRDLWQGYGDITTSFDRDVERTDLAYSVVEAEEVREDFDYKSVMVTEMEEDIDDLGGRHYYSKRVSRKRPMRYRVVGAKDSERSLITLYAKLEMTPPSPHRLFNAIFSLRQHGYNMWDYGFWTESTNIGNPDEVSKWIDRAFLKYASSAAIPDFAAIERNAQSQRAQIQRSIGRIGDYSY